MNGVRRTGRLVPLVVVAALAVGCSSGDDEGSDDVREQVRARLVEDLEIGEVGIDCPDADDSDELECVATIEGQTAPVQVRLDDAGVLDVELGAIVVDREELQASAAEETTGLLEQPTTVDCGEMTVVVIPAGDAVECSVTADDGTRGTAVIAIGSDGQPAVVELREAES